MIDLRDLYVRPGEPVMPAWQRLLEWAKQFRLYAGRGVRLNRTPNGTYVVADLKANPWNHPFKVRLAEREAAVGFGTVNGIVPRIGGKTIDGLDATGRETEPPKLPLTGEPNEDLRSWVAVDVKLAPESEEIDPDDPDAAKISHVRDLKPESKEVGRHPLAMLIWASNRTTIVRARPITHFNLRHLYVVDRAAEERPGRHLFWAT